MTTTQTSTAKQATGISATDAPHGHTATADSHGHETEAGDMDLDLALRQDRRDLRAAMAVFRREDRAEARTRYNDMMALVTSLGHSGRKFRRSDQQTKSGSLGNRLCTQSHDDGSKESHTRNCSWSCDRPHHDKLRGQAMGFQRPSSTDGGGKDPGRAATPATDWIADVHGVFRHPEPQQGQEEPRGSRGRDRESMSAS